MKQSKKSQKSGRSRGAVRALRIALVVAVALASALVSPDARASDAALDAASRVKWRVKVSLDYFVHDPGVGPDGTIYIPNNFGRTQAVDPADGSTKWVADYGGGSGPISVGPDGTVYTAGGGQGTVGGTDSISALRPDGTLKWMFTATRDGLLAGPTVGPDGNLYAVTDVSGIGFFSLTPAGQLRFATGEFSDYGPQGMNIAFGQDRAYFGFDNFGLGPGGLYAYDLNGVLRWTVGASGDPPSPAVGPNGNVVFLAFPSNIGKSVWSYTGAGQPVYKFYEFPGNEQSTPDVAVDNVAYLTRNLSTLLALNPSGTVKWRSTIDGITFAPRVNKQNTVVFMGGRMTYGQPGFVRAVTTAGQQLFQIALPDEPGFEPYGQLVPTSRPVFAPDGNTAYVVADVAGDGNVPLADTYAYLYAVDTSASATSTVPAAPTNLTGRAVSAHRIDLAWRDASNNETGFAIQRCYGKNCTSFVQIATVGPNVQTFSDTTVSLRGTYRYRVRAFNTAGKSAFSNWVRVRTTG
jgi:hypothetical protein